MSIHPKHPSDIELMASRMQWERATFKEAGVSVGLLKPHKMKYSLLVVIRRKEHTNEVTIPFVNSDMTPQLSALHQQNITNRQKQEEDWCGFNALNLAGVYNTSRLMAELLNLDPDSADPEKMRAMVNSLLLKGKSAFPMHALFAQATANQDVIITMSKKAPGKILTQGHPELRLLTLETPIKTTAPEPFYETTGLLKQYLSAELHPRATHLFVGTILPLIRS